MLLSVAGIGKLQLNEEVLQRDLNSSWEVLAEPIQTVMRRFGSERTTWCNRVDVGLASVFEICMLCRYGVEEPYEKLKAFTRGQTVTQESMQTFVHGLDGIPAEAKELLAQMSPSSYIGNAVQQATDVGARIRELRGQ